MKLRNGHTHQCEGEGCTVKVRCDGELRRNYDGWPEVICDDFHTDHRGPFLCETCEQKTVTEVTR